MPIAYPAKVPVDAWPAASLLQIFRTTLWDITLMSISGLGTDDHHKIWDIGI